MPNEAVPPRVAPLYLRPARLSAALVALNQQPLIVLAGGTDFYPARVGRPVSEDVLDITDIDGLAGIGEEAGEWRIGALTTWSDILAAPLPAMFNGLKRAAREVGGVQIQNAGTVVGNLCNASPAADGVPPLLALDAEVELLSKAGERRLRIDEFIVGNRRTLRRSDELVTAVRVRKRGAGTRSTFLKLGSRRYLVISIVMVAVCLEAAADGTVVNAAIAVGAASAVAQRLTELEALLKGRAMDASLADLAEARHLARLEPISDIRAGAQYRRDAALELVRRGISELTAAP
jgi:CO/xanthine dehydrogenase FAD-binding subunit